MTTMRGRLYDELAGMRAELARQSGQLAAVTQFMTTATGADADHEGRLRSLERWRYALPISAVSGAAALLLTVLHLAGH